MSRKDKDERLRSPWTAGVSGTVEPFQQLGVRSHAHFDHVGEGLHLEGPVVSATVANKETRRPNFKYPFLNQN